MSNFVPAVKPGEQLLLLDIARLSSFFLGMTLFIVAFVFITFSFSIYRHEVFADPKEIIESFGDVAPNDEEFFDDRIIEFAASTIKNRIINNNRAKKLKSATILMLIGITLHMVLLFLKLSI